MFSNLHQCPVCKSVLLIDTYYEEDPEFGSSLSLEVHCPKCKDTRVSDIDGINELLPTLIAKIGT